MYCNVELFVGKNLKGMSNLTRDTLVKSIVAKEIVSCEGTEYVKKLKQLYHKWEHVSSYDLCKKYNELEHTNVTVDLLTP